MKGSHNVEFDTTDLILRARELFYDLVLRSRA
jgi:hypothetical protein